jgi:hypothetical protein
LSGHALFHFWEVAVGICEPSVIARDFPAVTLPAIIGLILTLWAARDAAAAQNPPHNLLTQSLLIQEKESRQ